MAPTFTRKKRQLNSLINDNMMMVPTGSLKRYPKNPRVGDIEGIKESIKANGFAKVLLVQKSTRYVLDGNHTWQAASEMGYPQVPVAILDVSDEVAARIVLAANRLNDIATYDNDLLAEVLKGLGSPVGTGYSETDYQALMQAVEDSTTPLPMMDREDPVFGGEDSPLDIPDMSTPPMFDDEEGELEEAEEDLKGGFTLKSPADIIYEGNGYWTIPRLRSDMLATEDMIPRNLKAWAGSATKNWPDPDQWWLYNVGVDSTSGMNDVSKVIVSFYTWDHYFESWWVYPERWVAKLLNSKITMAVTPDWSMWSARPRVESLYSLYKQRFIGRYMQEAGLHVIPNICWPYNDMGFYDKYVRQTLPKRLPVVAMQMQTVDQSFEKEQVEELQKFIRHVMTSCNADLTIYYCGKQGREMLEDEKLENDFDILVVPFRTEALAEQAKGRSKKKTL